MKIVRAIVSKIKLSGFSKAGARSVAPKVNLASMPDTFTLSWEARMSKSAKKKFQNKPALARWIEDSVWGEIPKLDEKTVKYLNSLPEQEFLLEARRIICKARGIPENCIPAIIPVNMLPSGMAACYSFSTNIISYIPEKCIGRANLFSVLVHELTHTKQNLDIIRTKNLGKKHIYEMSKNYAKEIVAIEKNISIEQLNAVIATGTDAQKAYCKALLAAKIKGSEAEKVFFDKLYKEAQRKQYSALTDFRKRVIEEMGFVPIDSAEARFNHKMANALYVDKNAGKTQLTPECIYEMPAYEAGNTSNILYRNPEKLQEVCDSIKQKISMFFGK